jgi:hypothetical protein
MLDGYPCTERVSLVSVYHHLLSSRKRTAQQAGHVWLCFETQVVEWGGDHRVPITTHDFAAVVAEMQRVALECGVVVLAQMFSEGINSERWPHPECLFSCASPQP